MISEIAERNPRADLVAPPIALPSRFAILTHAVVGHVSVDRSRAVDVDRGGDVFEVSR
jgi:hypothetical protein